MVCKCQMEAGFNLFAVDPFGPDINGFIYQRSVKIKRRERYAGEFDNTREDYC